MESYRIACNHDWLIARVGHVGYQVIKDLIFLGIGIFWGLLQFSCMLVASPFVARYMKLTFKEFGYLLQAIVLEACCGMASFATRFSKPQYVPAAGDAKGPVIILIHGLMHNGAAWNYQRRQLMQKGYDVICPSWGGPFQSLETAAEKVYAIWQAEHAKHTRLQGRPVLLVGHSTGYAISQTLLRDRKFAEHDVAYVSVCGPTEGTKLAPTRFVPKLIRQMSSKSWDKSLTPTDHPTFQAHACRIIEVKHDALILSSGLERDQTCDIKRKLYNAGGHSSMLVADVTTQAIEEAATELVPTS